MAVTARALARAHATHRIRPIGPLHINSSRHATEASVLAQTKLQDEQGRVVTVTPLSPANGPTPTDRSFSEAACRPLPADFRPGSPPGGDTGPGLAT